MSEQKMIYDLVSRKFRREEVTQASGSAAERFYRGEDSTFEGSAGVSLTRAYAQSVWVMSAIKHSFEPIIAVPLEFSQGEEVLDDEDLAAWWAKPAECKGGMMAASELIACSVGWRKLAGEFFWILDDSWLTPGSIADKSPIMVARPDEMREVCDRGTGELVGWQWTPRDGHRKAEMLLPEQVIHRKDWNPYDPLRGLAEWQAVKMAAERDYSAGTFAKAVMDSNGDRGEIVTGDGAISAEQQDQITRILREKRMRAKRGDFVPAFLVGNDIKVNDPAIQAVDASFVASRMEDRNEVYVGFRVPPSMANVTASYSVGRASDRYRNLEENAMPGSKTLEEALEEVLNGNDLRPPVDEAKNERIKVRFEWERHPVMREVQEERIESGAKLWEKGVPWTAVDEFLDLGLPEFPGKDVARVPFNLVEVGGSQQLEVGSQQSLAVEDAATDDPVEVVTQAFQARAAAIEQMEAEEPVQERREPDARWLRVHGKRQVWEKRFQSRFRRLMMQARAEQLRRLEDAAERGLLEQASRGDGEVRQAGVADLGFELPEWLQEFLQSMTQVSRNAMDSARTELWVEELLREDDPAELPAREVREFLKVRENRMKDVAESLHREILDQLAEGFDEGETMKELQDRVRRTFNGISEDRAEMIARTETTAAYETSRSMTFKVAGVQWKEWVDSGLDNVRLSHREAHGQVVRAHEPFKVGGHKLMHPGDPEGPPEEVINCNCVMVAASEPADGRQ